MGVQNTSVIPNTLKPKVNVSLKNDNYSIGFVGLVPRSKRLDLAIELLEELLKHDSRYKLKVAGNLPEHYPWMENRKEESEFFKSVFAKLNSNQLLKNRVEFFGHVDNMAEFYASVGHVISTSDFESFHMTLADGPLHGAAAHTLRWDGSDDIYDDLWLQDNVESMSDKIQRLNQSNETGYHAYQQSIHLIKQMSPEIIALSILEGLTRR